MIPPKVIPTPVEAQVMWLRAIGADLLEICALTGRPVEMVSAALFNGHNKAKAMDLKIKTHRVRPRETFMEIAEAAKWIDAKMVESATDWRMKK